mgnify:CR=1 FL=1
MASVGNVGADDGRTASASGGTVGVRASGAVGVWLVQWNAHVAAWPASVTGIAISAQCAVIAVRAGAQACAISATCCNSNAQVASSIGGTVSP